MKYILTDFDSLNRLHDEIHDSEYSLGSVVFDRELREVVIDMERNEWSRIQWRDLLKCRCPLKQYRIRRRLRISDVTHLDIVDDAQIGVGDVNRLVLSEGVISIVGGLPVVLRIQTECFSADLEVLE